MGLLNALGRGGLRRLRSGEMFGQRVANAGDDYVVGGMRGLSETTPPDMAQRIRAFQSADARGLSGAAAKFHMEKEMLAQQLSGGDPQVMQMIRAARDEVELEDILGRIANPRSYASMGGQTGPTQMGADFGMRPPQGPWGR